MSLTEGTLLNNRYLILERLFISPYKCVYMAQDQEFGKRLVAIKETRQTLLDDDFYPEEIPDLLMALEREPILLASLSHQQISQYYDHFKLANANYLVMELVDGDELSSWMGKMRLRENLWGGPSEMRTQKVLAVAIQLCRVLSYLHIHDPVVLHRDIKPSNVLVTPAGKVVLIDFGISCALAHGQTGKTCWGLTRGYGAPEQERDEWSTVRTDIYSLGITLSCLLSGQHSPTNATAYQFAPQETIKPEPLYDLLVQMTRLDPEKRPASVQGIGAAFREILTELQRAPSTDEQLRQMLASPSVTYQSKGKEKTCYQGQTVWYQFRLPTKRQGSLFVPAKITYIRSQTARPDVEVAFINPHQGGKRERRWIHPSHLWKLSVNREG